MDRNTHVCRFMCNEGLGHVSRCHRCNPCLEMTMGPMIFILSRFMGINVALVVTPWHKVEEIEFGKWWIPWYEYEMHWLLGYNTKNGVPAVMMPPHFKKLVSLSLSYQKSCPVFFLKARIQRFRTISNKKHFESRKGTSHLTFSIVWVGYRFSIFLAFLAKSIQNESFAIGFESLSLRISSNHFNI